MREAPPQRRARGFTLVEVVAALVLLALLATVLLGIVGNAERSVTAATLAQERAEQQLRLRELLREHLGGLMPLRWRGELGHPLRFEGRPNSVTFLAPVLSHIAEGGVMWWRMEIDEENSARPRLVLRRLPQDSELREIPNFREAETISLAEGFSRLELRYFDPGGNPAEEPEAGKWVASWEELGRSPSAIEVRLFDAAGALRFGTVVQLNLSQAVGCNFDFERQRCVIPGVAP
ncbi:MAG: prepilin-type N-terminal cleavage/methylation domain-containing protein [Casimicrobiaceae bacterium]|nr:prepilin-type N-terminal cleavage/methylation domain-containing protein [Casimicrobiaceae bacterium]MCX8097692.1 prepilin-type N-terminal cleavage/methylation domain-containing protein [Casimicrobiaceae bacterium]MDW8312285.1 prepilin-type N-terminal cleavage/methylation domain-containing protein [Burkholderiales bacterium]